MYTLITFLLLLSSYALLRAHSPSPVADGGGPGWGWWSVFILANIAAAYAHYFAFVVIAFQLLYSLLNIIPHPASRISYLVSRIALAFLAILLSFLPWTPFVIARFGQDASYWQGALKLDEAVRHIFINFTMGESVLEAQAQWIAVGWLVCLVVGLLAWAIASRRACPEPARKSRLVEGSQVAEPALSRLARAALSKGRRSPILFVVLYLVIPLALLLLLFYRNPKFNARYLMIASPAFFLLLAMGLASLLSLARRKNPFAVFASIAVFVFLGFTSAYADSNAYFDPAFSKASFRDVAQYIDEHIAPDDAIILTSGHLFPAFDYYYRGEAPVVRLPDDATLNTDHVVGYDAANVLNQTLAGKRGAWVVMWQDEVVDPNGFIPMSLSSRGQEQKIEGTSFYQVRLRHWMLSPDARFDTAPQPVVARAANFKDKIKLFGFDSPTPTPADQGASFNLYWQSLDTFADDYQVALRVLDAAGNLWGKQDRRPAGYNYPTTRWRKGENLFGAYTVPLVAGAPAGNYFVEVTFYTASNPSGLDVLAPNSAPLGKAVKLGPIPVLPASKPASYAALNIQNSISQPLGPFTLLGYQLSRDKASAGETIPLTLFWRADVKPDKDYSFRLLFGDFVSDPFPISNLQFPTSTWRAGEIVRSQYSVAIPAEAKAGTLDLQITLGEGKALALAPFTIEKTDRVFVKPAIPFAQNTTFGDNYLALVGYNVTAAVKPGETVKLDLIWQARAKMDKPYTVFVHLLDKDGKVVAQKDAQPQNGARPTTGWVANEYLTDNYELPIPSNTAPGNYQIEIGWYDAKDPTYARLQVLDDGGVSVGDNVILRTTVKIGQ